MTCRLILNYFIPRVLFSLWVGVALLFTAPPIRADVVVMVTSDNNYAFGFGDVNGIDASDYYGCVNAPGWWPLTPAGCSLEPWGAHNSDGPERYRLPGTAYAGKYIYLAAWADGRNMQGIICQFHDDVTGKTVYSGRIPDAAGNADDGIQWEVFATGVQEGPTDAHPGIILVDLDCGAIAPGGFDPQVVQAGLTGDWPGCPPGSLAQQVNRWNCHISRANNYDDSTPLFTPGHTGGSASPGWIRYDGPVLGGNLHPDDHGDGSALFFDPEGNISRPMAAWTQPGFVGYFHKACDSVAGLFTSNAAPGPNGYRASPSWMWYHPDRDLDGSPDAVNPFNSHPNTPFGEWLIFRIGPLGELFGGDECSTENTSVVCDPDGGGTDYVVTFDVSNDSGYDVTHLLLPAVASGVPATFSNGSSSYPLSLPTGGTATGIQVHLSGGGPGSLVCFPIGLMAIDPGNGRPFECCGARLCVELPPCEVVDEEMFVRGDVDSDSVIQINDGIIILMYLFSGTMSPTCMDAADIDDDGNHLIVDAISIFQWLFFGSSPPPPPAPSSPGYPATDCGVDPSNDGFGCSQESLTCT